MLPFLDVGMIGKAPVIPGSFDYTAPGTYQFVVPDFNTLTVEVWGPGGGGAPAQDWSTGGNPDGLSKFDTVIANGGKGGRGGDGHGYGNYSARYAGGTASGGDINITGNPIADEFNVYMGPSPGGNAPNGGIGGAAGSVYNGAHGSPGGFPGAGGGGATYPYGIGGGGSSGGYAKKTFTPTTLPVGSVVTIVVGRRGYGGTGPYNGGDGADGRVKGAWS